MHGTGGRICGWVVGGLNSTAMRVSTAEGEFLLPGRRSGRARDARGTQTAAVVFVWLVLAHLPHTVFICWAIAGAIASEVPINNCLGVRPLIGCSHRLNT